MLDIHYNWLAVIVATFIPMIVGIIWYSKTLFGNHWSALVGMKFEDMGNTKAPMIFSFICGFLMSAFLALLIGISKAHSLKWGAFIALIVWIGFAFTALAQSNCYQKKPLKLTVIDTGYLLVSLLLTGLLLGIWY